MTSLPNEVGTTVLPDGREIGWAVYGDPTGDTVFWFPGSPGARHQVPVEAAAEARARGLRIITVERPGTGHSTVHHYERVIDFVDDFRAVADDFAVERFALVGLSGGGPFLLAVAHEMPDRTVAGVVLGGIGPTRGSDSIVSYTLLLVPAAPVLSLVRDRLSAGARSALRAVAPRGAQIGGPVIDAFFWLLPGERHGMGLDHHSKRQLVGDMIDAAERSGLGSPFDDLIVFGRHWGFRLDDIKVPIWFWGGTSDIIVPYHHAERQAKRVPGSRLRTVQDRGHFAGYTEPAEVLDVVREAWPRAAAKRTPKRSRRSG